MIAERRGLDTSTKRSLWKDRAMVELNVFHHVDHPNLTLKPNFFYQDDPWR